MVSPLDSMSLDSESAELGCDTDWKAINAVMIEVTRQRTKCLTSVTLKPIALKEAIIESCGESNSTSATQDSAALGNQSFVTLDVFGSFCFVSYVNK